MPDPQHVTNEEAQPLAPDLPQPGVRLLIGIGAVETVALYSVAVGSSGFRTYAAIHTVLCILFGLLNIYRVSLTRLSQPALLEALLPVVLTALLGCFGPAIAILFALQRKAHYQSAATESPVGNVDAESPNPFARAEVLYTTILDRRVRIRDACRVRPLMDVILQGSQSEKLQALGHISRHFAPALSPSLRRALQDRDNAVRVLAATVLAEQHNAYNQAIGRLQAAAFAEPTKAEHWKDLSLAHRAYAESGLLESARATKEYQHSETVLEGARKPGIVLSTMSDGAPAL